MYNRALGASDPFRLFKLVFVIAECVLEVAGSAAQPVAGSARAAAGSARSAAGSATGLATGLARAAESATGLARANLRAAGSAPRSVLSKCSKLDSKFGFQMLAHAVKSTIRRSSLTSLAGRTYVCLSRLTTTS